MSPSPEKIAANQANAQHSTGPRTEAGRAASAKNAVKSGLFAQNDFIRPGEEPMYDELDEDLIADLTPSGPLEYHYAEEIRRAMWRLRRCGEVEGAMVATCAQNSCTVTGSEGQIPDPMQNEATAKLQATVDRARAQCHRLINRSAGELRKLQTERHIRNENTEAGTDLSNLGLCETRTVRKSFDEGMTSQLINHKLDDKVAEIVANRRFQAAMAVPVEMLPSFNPAPNPDAKQTQPPAPPSARPSRNSRCACGSGQKYKRCCGRQSITLPQAA